MLRNSNTIVYRKRFFFGKNGCAGVAFFGGVIPVLKIAGQIERNLAFLQLALLDTENISVHLMKISKKSFLYTCTKSVYIPGYQFHSLLSHLFSFCCHLEPVYHLFCKFHSANFTIFNISLLFVLVSAKVKLQHGCGSNLKRGITDERF